MNKVILVGNPNVGKTTLFNTLTKSNEKASNWHGVTVDSKSKKCKINEEEFEITDLPGMYSLDGYSNEEKIASRFLQVNKNSLVVSICDANNLKRNLNLTFELIKKGYNVILAVNMINDFFAFDEKALSKLLGITVVGIDARKNKSVDKLKNAIYIQNLSKNSKKSTNNDIFCKNLQKINQFIKDLKKHSKQNISSKIDKILLNKFLFLPIFFIILFLIFYITFGKIGEFVTYKFNKCTLIIFNQLSNFVNSLNISTVIKDFFDKAILNSVSTIISFLPQIVLMLLLFNLIEDTGLVSRFAFMLDGFMKKIGLTGKSLFTLIMGYGCTSSAVLTTRNLETERLRKRTVLLLPFSSCSAKLPIFLLISSIFFDKYKYLFVFGLYLFSIFVMIVCAVIYKRIFPDKSNVFVLEMPRYRLPYLNKVLKDTIFIALEFIIKIGTTIVLFSVIFWLLQNFSIKFEFLNGQDYKKSILFGISNIISVIFKPIGLGNAGIVSVLIFGLVAKELIVVGLLFVNNVQNIELLKLSLSSNISICHFNNLTAIVFLIFILLYSPCISALSAIKTEFGRKTAWNVFIFQFIISYIICFFVYKLGCNVSLLKILVLIFLLGIAIIICFVLKYNRKNKCGGNCYACRKF